jgi:hypothetical protein
MIQIDSTRVPFTSPGVAFQAIMALGQANAGASTTTASSLAAAGLGVAVRG